MTNVPHCPRHARQRPPFRPRSWLVGLVVGVVLATSAGIAAAAWRTSASIPAAEVVAADMDVSLGGLTWECPDQGTSGDAATLPKLLLAPGQSVVLRQQVVTKEIGDNIDVSLAVGFPALPAGVTGNWHLEPADAKAAPATQEASLNEFAVLPDQSVTQWVAVVQLTLPAGDLVWADPTATPTVPALDLGALTVTAHQVRCGAGFIVPCAGEAR